MTGGAAPVSTTTHKHHQLANKLTNNSTLCLVPEKDGLFETESAIIELKNSELKIIEPKNAVSAKISAFFSILSEKPLHCLILVLLGLNLAGIGFSFRCPLLQETIYCRGPGESTGKVTAAVFLSEMRIYRILAVSLLMVNFFVILILGLRLGGASGFEVFLFSLLMAHLYRFIIYSFC